MYCGIQNQVYCVILSGKRRWKLIQIKSTRFCIVKLSLIVTNMPTIKLQTSDDEVFEVDIQIAKCSGTIRIMLEDCDLNEDENAVVPLPKVNSMTLSKVLIWANYHKDDPKPKVEEFPTNRIKPWDADFVKVDQGTLFDLILAANYLDIKELLDLTCKTVANMMRHKTSEDIRQTFSIKNDFTSEKEVQTCEESYLVSLRLFNATKSDRNQSQYF